MRRRASKPKRLRTDFPLFPHARVYWAKQMWQKLVYFGTVADDPDGAMALVPWLSQRDELLAGRTPRTPGDGCTLRDLCNRFLSARQNKLDAGEIVRSTCQDYRETCAGLIAEFGKGHLVLQRRAL